MGFCMGGALTMGALAASDHLVAGAPFYGVNFDLFKMEDLKGKSVQGHFGALDTMEGFSDPATGEKLALDMFAANGTDDDQQTFIYPGVGHAFMNDSPAPFDSFESRQETMGFPPFDQAQADHAWMRLLTFLGEHLGGKVISAPIFGDGPEFVSKEQYIGEREARLKKEKDTRDYYDPVYNPTGAKAYPDGAKDDE